MFGTILKNSLGRVRGAYEPINLVQSVYIMACAIDLHVDTPIQSLVELNMYKNDVLRRRISHAGCFMGTQFSELTRSATKIVQL